MKMLKTMLGGIVASALYVSSANALAVLNWDQSRAVTPTGTLSFDGTRLTGTNISFDLMSSTGTPLNAGKTYHCSNDQGAVSLGVTPCLLSFQTGPLQQQAGSVYIFGPGGSISMSGYLADALPGSTGPVIGGSPLVLSGTFAGSFTFTRGASALGSGAGFDVKDAGLAAHFGLPPEFRFAVTSIALQGCTAGATFTCQVSQADFQNTEVPEPASLALLGLGMLGIGFARRRIA